MKTLLLSICFAVALSAQTSIAIGTITVPTEVSVAVETWRLSQEITGNTALVGAITSGATSITVADASGIAVNGQIVIDTEALNVSAKTGNVLTVTRGATITTAAAHSDATTVRILRYANAVALMKAWLKDGVNRILSSTPSTTISTQLAAIATAQAAIVTFQATTVQ